MSLVNLSHVCSHLQNASLARLGLTSIPYSKLHLSLSLLLLKQGFISQLKLGGPSPPASCFPAGIRNDTAQLSPDGALQRVVAQGWNAQRLREEGYEEEDVEFALSQCMKSKEQFEREGWDEVAFDFLIRHMWPRQQQQHNDDTPADLSSPSSWKSQADMEADGLSDQEIGIIQSHQPLLATTWRETQDHHPNEAASTHPGRSPHFRLRLKRKGLPIETLMHSAGPTNSLRTERDLKREGFSLQTMGLEVPNQLYNPPANNALTRDPMDLETEGLVTQANRASRRLWLGMKYWDGLPVLRKARMISKPTKRFYLSAREIQDLCRGRGAAKNQVKPLVQVGEIMAVVTERGVLEARECVERGLGGLVLCRIW